MFARQWHLRVAVIALVSLLLGAGIPPVAGEDGDTSHIIDVCFSVRNVAGWPLARINVTAIRASPANLGVVEEAQSDANGFVRMPLERSVYRFVLTDDQGPLSPLRNGATYLPTFPGTPVDPNVPVPASNTVVSSALPNGCGAGQAGFPLNGGVVVMNSPAVQGYLEVAVIDAATGAAPLAGARVSSATQQGTVSQGAIKEDPRGALGLVVGAPAATASTVSIGGLTAANGKVRMACIGGAPNNVTVSKDAFLLNDSTTACEAQKWNNHTVRLWRSPVSYEITVTNETPLVTNRTGLPSPGVGPLTPLTNARASVADLPPTLSWKMCSNATIPASAPIVELRLPPVRSGATPPYVCDAGTDGQGRATLLLPWIEAGLGEYEVTTSAPGYSPHVDHHGFSASEVLGYVDVEGQVVGTGLHQDAVTLTRATVTLTGVVRDIHLTPFQGATLFFNGTDAAGISASVVSGPGGAFSLPLTTGPYDITITNDTKQRRTCEMELGVSATGAAEILDLEPAHCFRLVASGKAAVIGVITDVKFPTVPAPDQMICFGPTATTTCDNTSADGSWELEVAPSTALTGATGIRSAADAAWTTPTTAFSGNSPAAGEITDTGSRVFNRKKIGLTIHVENATAAPLQLADVAVLRDATKIHDDSATPFANVTDAAGNYAIPANRDNVWSKRTGYPQFDISPYIASASKHRSSGDVPLYALKASAGFHLLAETTSHTQPLVLDEIAGAFSVAILAWDPHIEKHVENVTLRAIVNAGTAAGGPDSINVTKGSSTLTLYSQFAPYKVCVQGDAFYQHQPNADTRCKTGIMPGMTGAVNVTAPRTTVNITFRGVDPHTDRPLSAYNATVQHVGPGTFECDPDSKSTHLYSCVRQGNATGNYQHTFVIPWTSQASDLCIVGSQRSYAVQHVASPLAQTGETVGFRLGTLCQVWEPGEDYTIDVRPLRAPAQNAISGTAKLFTGPVATGAVINVTSDRSEFRCDPKSHHTIGASFPGCDGTPVDANGFFSVVVPMGGPNSTWNATAKLAGHYSESYNLWPANVTSAFGAFTLYPRAFDAVITILDQAAISTDPLTTHACGSLSEWETRARIKDLRDLSDPNPNAAPPHYNVAATRQADGTCRAVIKVLDWHRDPPTLPALLNTSWPVTTSPFIASAYDELYHVGYMLAALGPADADRNVQVVMLHGDGTDNSGEHTLRGRITDADAIATVSGAAGVPARVSATPTGVGCLALATSTITKPDGSYTLPLDCAGPYTITVTPLIATHWETTTATVTIPAADAEVTKDVAIKRKTTTLTVTVIAAVNPVAPARNVRVDPEPIDATTDPEYQRTNLAGQATFGGIPWGLYELRTGTFLPAGGPAYVAPGTSSHTVVYVT